MPALFHYDSRALFLIDYLRSSLVLFALHVPSNQGKAGTLGHGWITHFWPNAILMICGIFVGLRLAFCRHEFGAKVRSPDQAVHKNRDASARVLAFEERVEWFQKCSFDAGGILRNFGLCPEVAV